MNRVGVDLVEVERVRGLVEKWGDRFLHRVFSDNEIAYSFGHRDPWPHLAARFAAKEALIKALGKVFTLRDVSVENDDSGRPVVHFTGSSEQMVRELGFKSLDISLSHTKKLAIAMVVIE
ncbi:MAG: holo-ACP synthase [Proteobacteria bacterium]|nr:holo-ACP synthase [Pseudomonadota bacterium]